MAQTTAHPACFSAVLDVLRWLGSRGVTGTLRSDSRQVAPGDVFIAWPGFATDGRAHVRAAFAQGAAACLVEADGVERFDFGPHADAVAACSGLKALTGPLACAWFGEPSQALDVLAVTGTNGKTSTAWWLALALSKLELYAPAGIALVGTLGMGVAPKLVAGALTTPDPVALQQALAGFVRQGVGACAIEASSIGLAEARLAGTRIRLAIFTNFTQDHLDYHGSMQAYWIAKQALFDWPGLRAAVVNLDDPAGRRLADRLQARAASGSLALPELWTFSLQHASAAPDAGAAARGNPPAARIVGSGIATTASGRLQCTVTEGGHSAVLTSAALGDYNLGNLMGVIGALRALGVPLAEAVAACADLPAVPGRMDWISEAADEPLVVVDFAHTPDALAKALQALRPLARQRGGALICVFGCGGARDAGKRPLMAAVAAAHADAIFITSDNPRDEDPLAIIEQVGSGLGQGQSARIEPDRALAISAAICQAGSSDIVLLAGKGHETTQETAGVRTLFSDRAHALDALAMRATAGIASTGARASAST